MIEFRPIRHHMTRSRQDARLCDGGPAADEDIPVADIQALRDARGAAELCPECQENSGLPGWRLRPARNLSGPQPPAVLYTIAVQNAFDAVRNCSHCRRDPGRRETRTTVRTLYEESVRLAQDVRDLPEITGGAAATIYRFFDGSVWYFAKDAEPWQEAGAIAPGAHRQAALHILESRGCPGGKAARPQHPEPWATGQRHNREKRP